MASRLSVTLTSVEDAVVQAFADPDTADRAALRAWAEDHGVDLGDRASEAAIVRALLQAGAQALRLQALDDGYAQLASDMNTEEAAERHVARDRYVDRTDRHAPE